MKYARIAALAVVALAAMSGVATAQKVPPVQGYIAYHYNQEAEPRFLVATSGQNCDGIVFHDPLYVGQHVEYFYYDC